MYVLLQSYFITYSIVNIFKYWQFFKNIIWNGCIISLSGYNKSYLTISPLWDYSLLFTILQIK